MKNVKRYDMYGIEGSGRTLRDAKKSAEERVDRILRAIRDDSRPVIVSHEGYIGIAYRDFNGVNAALIASPDEEVRVGPVMSNTMYPEGSTIKEAAEHLLFGFSQLAWKVEDGFDPPDILKNEKLREEFRGWARWQTRYHEGRQKGMSDEDAFRYASGSGADENESSMHPG